MSETITAITAEIRTVDSSYGGGTGPGTDGYVCLGLAGREFHANTSADDFEDGAQDVFVFGENATVLKPEINDPRNPQLTFADLHAYPAYVRFDPAGDNDDWHLERATVTITGSNDSKVIYSALAGDPDHWLGKDTGLIMHLHR
ncbi:hypothetical protein AB0I81_55945 [Nonomuraea sp. NPDC050404]|uniref:hypothetical protein n=1 Tax=Nonomuraea sp. NPDC050404 TaxID=3155783 RepID=UPI0033F8E75E